MEEKVIVVHNGGGINDSFKKMVEKKLGSNLYIKPVHIENIINGEEFEYKLKAKVVIWKNIEMVKEYVKLWPYQTEMIFIGMTEGGKSIPWKQIPYIPQQENK